MHTIFKLSNTNKQNLSFMGSELLEKYSKNSIALKFSENRPKPSCRNCIYFKTFTHVSYKNVLMHFSWTFYIYTSRFENISKGKT